MHIVFTQGTQILPVLGAWQVVMNTKVFLKAGVLLLLLCISNSLCSQEKTLELTTETEILFATDYLECQPGLTAEEYALEELTSQSFKKLNSEDKLLLSGRNYWFRLRLKNNLPNAYTQAEWVLQFPLLLTDVYYLAVDENGRTQEGRTGLFTRLSDRTFAPTLKGNFAKIYLPAQQEVEVYLRLRCDRKYMAPTYEVKVTTAENFYHKFKNKKLFNGMFFGFIILILLYNLFLFLLARDRAFIYYSLYLLALLVFTVYNSGDLADLLTHTFFPNHPTLIYFSKLSVYLIVVGYLAFLRSFLDLNELLPIWDRIFNWFSYIAFLGVIVDIIAMIYTNFNYVIADAFGMFYMISFLFLMGSFLFVLMKTDDPKRYFILGGVIAMILGISFTIIDRMQNIDFSTVAYKIGTVIEVVIFSLGLVYRQREAEQQKQEVQFALEKATLLQQQKEKEVAQIAELHAAKEWFYTHITHELRTPLTVVLGITEHLQDLLQTTPISGGEKEDWESSIDLMERNSTHLLRQVNQLLDLARLEAGAMQLHLIEDDIIAYLGYLTESFYSLANDQGVKLSYQASESELIMSYDELKIQQVIFNLLSNAIKFSKENDEVKLEVDQLRKEGASLLQIKVIDTGIGIPPEDVEDIFSPFYQASNRNQSVLGTGVGLTLTHQLVKLMSGKITVVSTINKGSIFTITIPIRNTAKTSFVQRRKEQFAKPMALATKRVASQKHRQEELPLLLLVEDNKDVLGYLQKILKATYRIIIANDGMEGTELAYEHLPDLIISDVMMPGLDGYGLCQALKTDIRTSHIPIVLLTAKAEETDKLVGLEYGADAYLVKPFNRKELLLRLKNLLALRKQLQEYYRIGLEEETMVNDTSQLKGINSSDMEFLTVLKRKAVKHLGEDSLTSSFLAQSLNLSTTQFYRKLKALTNQTPTQYIRDLRLKEARHLLKSTRMQIAEIAYKTGFSDPNYFSRAFHRFCGKSPRDFRKEWQ